MFKASYFSSCGQAKYWINSGFEAFHVKAYLLIAITPFIIEKRIKAYLGEYKEENGGSVLCKYV